MITSSEVLAVREANDPRVKKFFRLLGLSVAHCITDDWARQWHKADVVYGDALNFQADYLEQIEGAESTESPTTNSRFDCVIYDEVDNILVDNGAVSTLLTYPFPGMEYLELVLHTMFQHVQLLVDKVSNAFPFRAVLSGGGGGSAPLLSAAMASDRVRADPLVMKIF